MDGNQASQDQLTRFMERLRYYRDRMLHVDWRNRSILLRRADKKWTMDLGSFWKGDLGKLDDTLKKGVWTRSSICLVKDSEHGDEPEAARSNLTYLERSTRLIFEETGVSDSYLAFPFLTGHAGKESFIRAPLVLFPIRFERVRHDGIPGWYLVFAEDEYPVVNRALVAALRKTCGILLPDDLQDKLDDILDSAPREGLTTYLMQQLQSLFKQSDVQLADLITPVKAAPLVPLTADDLGKMPVSSLRIEPIMVVGEFPQGSTAIFHDYEEMIERAERGEHDQGVIDDLLEAPSLRGTRLDAPLTIEIDSTPDREMNMVLASDASQDTVLLEAQKKECVVVRGPPGTGKSQVITNLVTNALAKNERVLVVCQKRAALDVVYQRLGRVGLSESVVLLHDARADRQGVYSVLSKRMSGDPPRPDERLEREFQETSTAIDQTIAELNSVVKPLWFEYFGGTRLHELYTAATPGYSPSMDMGTLPSRMTRQSLSSMLQRLPTLQIGHWKYDRSSSPLAKRRSFASLDSNARFEMDSTLVRAVAACVPDALALSTRPEQQDTMTAIKDYEALRSKGLKRLNPKWWSASKAFSGLQTAYPNDPRTTNPEAMKRSLALGAELQLSFEGLNRWISPDGMTELLTLRRTPAELKARLQAMRSMLGEFDAIQEHDRNKAALDPVGSELFSLCAIRLPADQVPWAKTVEQETVLRWIGIIESSQRQLSGDPFGRYLELKKRLDALLAKRQELLKKRLERRVLAAARTPQLPPGDHHPNKRPETEWNKLLSEFEKKRRVKPVRKLMEEYPFQMMTITPCWLVSPEAASEIFPLQRGLFDLVIFDESSQLAVERSLPALYRGKRVLVGGDEKQLRPFDLFQTRDGEEEVDEVTEAESLLVLGMRVLTPRYLSWHYRSKYQELIDFSNHAFYDGNLEIAANVQRKFDLAPIDFVRCEGTWDERTNLVEGEKVVDLIHWLLSEGELRKKVPTIGVITFNEPQRDFIQDAIETRRSQDKDFERLFGTANSAEKNLDDRPFVKNIENVQGDERDVIIFSVAYGKDKAGKFRVLFGSLNQEGGENRLNVAITRAREQVIMVTSFDPPDLPVEDSKNLGPKRLKEYLTYAKAVSEMRRDDVALLLKRLDTIAPGQASSASAELGMTLERQLGEALRAQGLTVEEKVGFSGYKIDLAIVDPNDATRYVMGIETDGATFQTARSARERDVVRQKFLEDRGWTIERVWSRNWWRNRQGEIDRLQARAKALSEENRRRPAKPAAPMPGGAGPTTSKQETSKLKSPEEMTDRVPTAVPPDLPYSPLSAVEKDGGAMRLTFFDQLRSGNNQMDVKAAEALLDWADEAEMMFWWGEFRGLLTVTPYFKHRGQVHWLCSVRADGAIDLDFAHLKVPFDSPQKRRELLHRLNQIPKLSIPEDYADKSRTIMLERLRGDAELDVFVKTMRWFLEEIKKASVQGVQATI